MSSITPKDNLIDKIVSNAQQVKDCGGSVILTVTKGDKFIREIAD